MLRLDDITTWNTPSAAAQAAGDAAMAAEIYANWQTGVAALYKSDADFQACIKPFDEYAHNYSATN